MVEENDFKFCFEYGTVEEVVEVGVVLKATGDEELIRIFALRDGRTGAYWTRAEIRETFTLHPTFPINEETATKSKDVELWVRHDLPQTTGQSADDVIRQALAWLEEECKPSRVASDS